MLRLKKSLLQMSKIPIILKREFLSRVRKRSFLIVTLLVPVLISIVLAISIWLSLQENQKQHILIVDDNYPVFQQIKNEKGLSYYYQDISLEKAEKLMFLDGSIYTGILYLPENIMASNASKLYVKKQPGAITQRRIEKQIENIIENQKLLYNKIPKEIYNKINTEFHLTPFKINENGEESKINSDQAFVGFGFAILIWFMIMMYGTMVMRSVMEEKVNRIVEVIISSVKPFELMMGKIIGVAFVGLLQVLMWGILSSILFVAIQFFFIGSLDLTSLQDIQTTKEVGRVNHTDIQVLLQDPNFILNRINFAVMIPLFLFYFLGGYLLYAALFAAVGALIDSESETQQFVTPLTLPLLIAYVMAPGVINNPESISAVFTSIFPFTSPVTMMIRMSIGVGDSGGLPIWQVLLSMALLILTFLCIIWLASKIYRAGILHTGKRPSFKKIFSWLKNA